ncbi:MAG: 4-(cytidine 5'-diphospho)-2-C-methyl-D-erythritol kinase [Betaproteobacteria bacterium]|nr:4-(cytidine 5'-diphospho)-2-C-methyl-D-erythritol kinase [Betaproteobacteria bacterium]
MRLLRNVPAPAKLNLFLHVTGKRPDGYHLLQSVFMLVNWWDVLHFERRTDGLLLREDLTTALPTEDLCLRAAHALKAASGTSLGALIQVDKRLPTQAGLGGGSSDAATCLLALNRLWGLNWPLSRLLSLALTLGADVPFFVRGHNAWVQGMGEDLQPVQLPRARFAILKPAQGLETARVFQDAALKRDTSPATIIDFAAQPFAFGRNDLQAVAQALSPEVNQALKWLENQGLKPRMTGSGSAVFALVGSHAVLTQPPHGWQLQMCSNLDIHPLAGWVSCDD